MNYEVVRSKRKTMSIHVYRDQRVVIRAPLRCKDNEISVFFKKYRNWVENKLHESRKFPGLSDSQYRDDGFLWLLGKSLSISVKKSNSNRIAHRDDRLIVYQTDVADSSKTFRMINKWKRNYALAIFQNRLAFWFEQFPLQLKDYQIRLRKMKRQWGNCNHLGVITINSQLVRYPESCIDYVLVHELTHLKYLHHGRAFYRLLENVMPDWQQHKLELSQFSGSLQTRE